MVFLSLKLIHSDSLEPFLTVCFAPLQTKDIEARANFLQREPFLAGNKRNEIETLLCVAWRPTRLPSGPTSSFH